VEEDSYKTVAGVAEAVFKDKGSKFLAYSYHVESEEETKELVDALRKKYYDATHHCYAYRLGAAGDRFRANDDGEPSGTAGRPILGQMLSAEITNALIVVVRYFGGTKLGVPGLINAYKESARAVIAESRVETRTVDALFEVVFDYEAMDGVMKIVKDLSPRVVDRQMDNVCTMLFAVRRSMEDTMRDRLDKCEGVRYEVKSYV
jgi:uncharacterized YigZ family protein